LAKIGANKVKNLVISKWLRKNSKGNKIIQKMVKNVSEVNGRNLSSQIIFLEIL
jgi:hypothetical protein